MEPFGKTSDGREVSLYTLANQSGMEVKITNYGGTVTSIKVKDRHGKFGEVVLGFDSLDGYVAKNNTAYFGALIGRYANRIAKGTFALDGRTYQLKKDNMLIADAPLGKALAATLGDKAVVLMRGHGDVVVGPSVPIATYRAIYTDINARLQAQAIALGGTVTYLEEEEGRKADAITQQIVTRPWELWKAKALGRQAAGK